MSNADSNSSTGEKRKLAHEESQSEAKRPFQRKNFTCSLSKVFYHQLKQSPSCEGKVEELSNISVHDRTVILNRLTPCSQDISVLSGIKDICAEHKAWLGSRHPVEKRIRYCEIQDCGNKCGSRRVTLAMSQTIFVKLGEHVPFNSPICESHRKKLSASEKSEMKELEHSDISGASGDKLLVKSVLNKETQTENEIEELKDRGAALKAKKSIAHLAAVHREDSFSSDLASSQSQGYGGQSESVDSSLAIAVLLDLTDYLIEVKKDRSRNGYVQQTLFFESIVGKNVCDGKLINNLKEQLGMNGNQLYKAAKSRKQFEENESMKKILCRIKRKSPEGEGYVSPEWMCKVVDLSETDECSDIEKGHHSVLKEIIRTSSGNLVIYRQKRILKLTPLELHELAVKTINWPFTIRTLLQIMPPWIRHPRKRYLLGCLCTQCTNLRLKLKALVQLINSLKNGKAIEKLIAEKMVKLTESITDVLNIVLHPIKSEKEWHDNACYDQKCNDSRCGPTAFDSFFSPLTNALPERQVEVLEHIKIDYIKPDGKSASKWDQVLKEVSVSSLILDLKKQLFGDGSKKENFLEHDLRKKLASKARHNNTLHLKDNEAICNSDFSKELELIQPEKTKNEYFGASHHTLTVIPINWELTVMLPGPVSNLHMDSENKLRFLPPADNGGSHISAYEVHIKSEQSTWYFLVKIDVQYLSDIPSIPENVFGQLKGDFLIKVVARNKAGRGSPVELNIVGQSARLVGLDITNLDIICDENRQHELFMEEFIFVSDHHDVPKDSRTIRKCNQIALESLRSRGREIETTYHRTDTGGENWGVLPCSMYSYSKTDYKTLAVWVPTAAQHSGQLSDATGGVFKRGVNDLAAAGRLRGIRGAKDLVGCCKEQPMFKETCQQRFLQSSVMNRTYIHITKSDVLDEDVLSRTVEKLPGISQYKQVFSTNEPGHLWMRKRTCTCAECLSRNWDDCSLKEYVDTPKLVKLKINSGHEIPAPDIPDQDEDGEQESVENNADLFLDTVVEKNKFYAVWSTCEEGYSIVKVSGIGSDVIQGFVVNLNDCPRRQYKFSLNSELKEFRKSEIFTSVEVSGNSISKKIIEDILVFVSS